MSDLSVPFNIKLLVLTDDKLVGLKPVTVLDAFDGASKNFHESGLFSTSIFGKVGEDQRSYRYSYINIKLEIFHPIVYRALIQLRRYYADIISGMEYATWNELTGDFEKSSSLIGETGFHFFKKHWQKIVFEKRPSDTREQNIKLLQMYKDSALISKIIVMPAGLRDLEIDADGRFSEDEINTLYRKLLALSNSVPKDTLHTNPEILDRINYSMQSTFNQVYDQLEDFTEGKKKLLMGKWASRRIFNGTRNVITAFNNNSKTLGSPGNFGFNDTVIGLYQYYKANMPVCRYMLRTGFLSKVFTGPNSPVTLINKKTLKKEIVEIDARYHDAWMSDEGLEKVITSFGEEIVRHRELEIAGKYVGLIYKGPDNTFKLMQDIDELPVGRLKEHVMPMTFCELLYISIYKKANDYPLFVTRFPVTGFGSIYPSMSYLRPTVSVEERRELDDEWLPGDDKTIAYQFPVKDASFVNSTSPHPSRLSRLNADFDGDTASSNIVYSDEAIAEVKQYINSKKYYVGSDGKINFSADTATVSYVLKNMTGSARPRTY